MADKLRGRLLVHESAEALSLAAAAAVSDVAQQCAAARGRFTLCLAGGDTPRLLYQLLAQQHSEGPDAGAGIPWEQTHIFWGDERFVPADDPRSNQRMVREALLDHLRVAPAGVFPIPTTLPDPQQAAAAYEATLRAEFAPPAGDAQLPLLADGWPRFDLMLLGLGADGHTASLFPRSPTLRERTRWVVAAHSSADPSVRISLSLPVLNHSARIYVLVAGAAKAVALRRAATGQTDPELTPAAGLRPVDGELIWWVDTAAAGSLG